MDGVPASADEYNPLCAGWAGYGIFGILVLGLIGITLGVLWWIGDVSTDAAHDVKWKIDTWYVKRQLEHRPVKSFEDNGKRKKYQ